ncbi:MAG: endonuclease domain-containing protein, partial [Prevotellaceae bacterium]|nr:endonuclease domain-containing protein [Prevotellaceae bacterium]
NRTALTAAESFLWEHIRRKALGVKFRRQVPIGDYIADFMDTDTKIIIEVDGEYHNTPEQIYYDNLRTDYLNKHGYYVMRFKNEEILGDIRSVTEKIKYLIDKTRK